VSARTATATAICGRGWVRQECLAYALNHPELAGIWGGTSARERMRLRKAAAASAEWVRGNVSEGVV
jgi:WhiB family transcriptional regulator, redox-sensing transcriptional regulator